MRGKQANAMGHDSRYEMLLNAIPSAVLLVGRDLRVSLANRDFLERSRRTREETLYRRLPEVLPPAIVDHTGMVRHIQSVFETNKPVTGERITFPAPEVRRASTTTASCPCPTARMSSLPSWSWRTSRSGSD